MFPEWTLIVGFYIGAAIGSFLNVVIYRMPRLISLGNPRHSFCPNCKTQLGLADLAPLFSWLFSKGQCRYCAQKVPSRYFWVELVTGVLFSALWYRYYCEEPTGQFWLMGTMFMLATAALIAIIFIDGAHFIIPDEINGFLLLVGVVFHAINGTLKECAIGYLVGWGIIFGIAFLGRVGLGKDAMGHGDIKMMRGVGALIGPILTVFDVMIAVVTGLIFGVLFIALEAKKLKQQAPPEEAEATESSEEEEFPPEPIKDLLILSFTYLICLDLVAILRPQVYAKLGYPIENISVEEDDWKPTLTTIPFGPYLAIGALVCMLFRTEILNFAENYIRALSGPV